MIGQQASASCRRNRHRKRTRFLALWTCLVGPRVFSGGFMVPESYPRSMRQDHSLRTTRIILSTALSKPTEDFQAKDVQAVDALLDFVDRSILEESYPANLVLERIKNQHEQDFKTAESSCLDVEAEFFPPTVPYDTILPSSNGQSAGPFLAIRSREPLLDRSAVKAIREEAERIWKDSQTKTSRFTYQYTGNSEAHVFDFESAKAIEALNESLHTKVYPMIREAFFKENLSQNDDATKLFVYDALVIRYNATAAMEDFASAGQPLHRDLGLVSVNIMLNPETDFAGGGTFFENQLLGDQVPKPLKPLGVGHSLAHSASKRHAGAGTTKGVRDILVLFVSATVFENGLVLPPAEISSLLLKNCKEVCEKGPSNQPIDVLKCRILHQKLAVQQQLGQSLLLNSNESFCDGEALLYLGSLLMEYADFANHHHRSEVLGKALECLQMASLWIPCDSRVYNNMGITIGKIREESNGSFKEQERSYRKGLSILNDSMEAGCSNDGLYRDRKQLSLNYALCLANEDRFHEAATVLGPILDGNSEMDAITNDMRLLWQFCKKR